MIDTAEKHEIGWGRGYLLVFFMSGVLYAVSCSPSALWQDSGMILYRVWHNDIQGSMGLALSHPLFYLVGIAAKAVPIGEFGWRISSVSGIFAAIAVANVFLLLRLMFGSVSSAVVGAMSLAVSWTFWQHGVMAETYTLTAALLTIELVFLCRYFQSGRKRYLYLLFFVNGLAISNHMLAVISLAVYVVCVVWFVVARKLRLVDVVIIAGVWMIGAVPYEYLIVTDFLWTGDLVVVIRSALFGDNWAGAVLNTGMSKKIVLENIMFIGYSFATVNILLVFAGVGRVFKSLAGKAFGIVLAVIMAGYLVFAFRYTVLDRYAFFIPFYCLLSVFIGAGAGKIFSRYRSILVKAVVFAFVVMPIGAYWFVPIWAQAKGISVGTKRVIPFRDDHRYFLRPWKGADYSAERFGRAGLGQAEKDAVIIADGTVVYALWYVQEIYKIRPDVRILSKHGSYESPLEFPTAETIGQMVAGNPVYVVSDVKGYCPEFILEKFVLVKEGVLYRVQGKNVGDNSK